MKADIMAWHALDCLLTVDTWMQSGRTQQKGTEERTELLHQ